MSAIPKHEARGKGPKKAKAQPASVPAITLDADLSGIEIELANLARSVKSYVVNAVDAENSLNLFTGQHSYPVRLVLECEAVDSIADSLKRIADAIQAKP
jgi:hypothetical protein